MARKKTRRGKRYGPAVKQRILAAARKAGLTAVQVQKRFGVSPLTFYRWRGPVRGRKRGRPRAGGSARVGRPKSTDLRAQVQARVREVLPAVIREEVSTYLAGILGVRGPGRPRGTGRRRRRGRPRKAK